MQIQILASGSSGNAAFFELGNTKILIDAGISARRIERSLATIGVKAGELDAILITHEHTDHTNGVDVLSRRYHLPVYARPLTWNELRFREKLDKECRLEMPDSFAIGQVKVEPFNISHDAVDPVGFCLHHEDRKYVIATDLGKITPEVKEALAWADIAVLEANHDLEMLATGPYPVFLKRRIRSAVGHLSNNDAALLLANIPKKTGMHVFLAHLSQKNNHPVLAERTVSSLLSDRGCDVGRDIVLLETYPSQISGYSR